MAAALLVEYMHRGHLGRETEGEGVQEARTEV